MTKGKKPMPREAPPAGGPKPGASELESLLAERRKYEEWIAALDAKKEETPPHVFTRVRADYEQRLRAATEKLASHSGSLGEEQTRLEGRIEELDLQIRDRRDQRAEIELRAHVGEISDEEVATAYAEADEGLAKLTASRAAAAADLGKIKEMLSSVTTAKPAPQPATKPVTGAQRKPGFDELSFLQSVVGAEQQHAEGVAARPATASAPPPPVHRESGASLAVEKEAPVLDLKPAATPPASPQPQARLSIAMQQASMTIEPEDAARLSRVVKAEELAPSLLEGVTPKAKPLSDNAPSNDPMMFSPATAGGVKNLKCKSCGTMNDPREWYCEKCGAELAVV